MHQEFQSKGSYKAQKLSKTPVVIKAQIIKGTNPSFVVTSTNLQGKLKKTPLRSKPKIKSNTIDDLKELLDLV